MGANLCGSWTYDEVMLDIWAMTFFIWFELVPNRLNWLLTSIFKLDWLSPIDILFNNFMELRLWGKKLLVSKKTSLYQGLRYMEARYSEVRVILRRVISGYNCSTFIRYQRNALRDLTGHKTQRDLQKSRDWEKRWKSWQHWSSSHPDDN